MAQAAKSTRFMLTLVLASVGAAIVTFIALTNQNAPFGKHPDRLWLLLLLDIALLVGIGALITRQIGTLWGVARSGVRKSKLQRRIVRSFCIVTALPTVVVSIFSIVFFNLGIQAWFNERVSTVVDESLAVAEAYLDEHKENIRVDALALAEDINRYAALGVADPLEFNRFVSEQAARRRITEVVVFQGNHIIAQGRLSFTIAFESLPQATLARAAEGEVVILPANGSAEEDRVRALVRLDSIDNGYLMVGRLIDDKVIGHMERTQGAVNEYHSLKNQLVHLQWTFSAVFAILTLVLLLAAIWYGLMLAARLTTPVIRLAVAAERVRAGDYTGRVEVGGGDDEISVLSRTFNRMTDQLDQQRGELIKANRQLDERGRFTEAVLGGVSAGVLALDAERRITLCNRSAAALLQDGDSEQVIQGRHVNEVLPGIHELLAQAEAGNGELEQGSITLGTGSSAHTLHVRVVAEAEGAIVTFDDITPLVAAQRTAAWSDVARRVAHEIKNPLTPIALSAERLKRKYLGRMEGEEAESFSRYVDTIARHVGDIGRMVEEFVSFARMPGAVMKQADLLEIVRKEVFSEQVAHPAIQYRLASAENSIPLVCDERQLSQVFINLLKNAAEAIEDGQMQHGEIAVGVTVSGREIFVVMEDNGPGFPPDKIHAILEPYVTTRTKGTGLGLAIVKKIMEENNGNIQVANRPEGGARVTLSFLQQRDINATG